MESTDVLEVITALIVTCVALVFVLQVFIHALRHSLDIIRTQEFQQPTGKLITGQKAVQIGVIRALVSGISIVVVSGVALCLILLLCVAALK